MNLGWRENAEAVALHWLVRAALRIASPPRAFRWVGHVARHFPPLHDSEHALAVERALGSAGTCLSRSLSIAARLPRAEVVIGIDPWGGVSLRAHAWVELDGARLDPEAASEFAYGEIARLTAAHLNGESGRGNRASRARRSLS